MKVLGPGDPWPSHDGADAQKALEKARRAGWTLQKYDGHSWGRIQCPHGHSEPSCSFTVFKTASDKSSSVAGQGILAKLRQCEKRRRGVDGADVPEMDPAEALASAERLMGAAEMLRASEWAAAGRDELLEDAEAAVPPDDDRFIEDAIAADRRATESSLSARAIAYSYDFGEPWPPEEGVSTLTDEVQRLMELASPCVHDPELAGRYAEAESSLRRLRGDPGIGLARSQD